MLVSAAGSDLGGPSGEISARIFQATRARFWANLSPSPSIPTCSGVVGMYWDRLKWSKHVIRAHNVSLRIRERSRGTILRNFAAQLSGHAGTVMSRPKPKLIDSNVFRGGWDVLRQTEVVQACHASPRCQFAQPRAISGTVWGNFAVQLSGHAGSHYTCT